MKYYTCEKEVTEIRAKTKYKLFDDDNLLLDLDLPFDLKIIYADIAIFSNGGYSDDDSKKKMVIFDLANGVVINDKFNKIYNYQECNGEKRARADIYIKHNNKVITISCYIDILGNIVSKVIDNRDCIPFDANLLDDHIAFIKKSLEDEERQFMNLLQNEEKKILKISLNKKISSE